MRLPALLAAAALLTIAALPVISAGALGDAVEYAAAAAVDAKCSGKPLDGMYCRVLQDPGAVSGGDAGCCGGSTQSSVTPGLVDPRNVTVSYAPTSVGDCFKACAANPGCLTASAFSATNAAGATNLFCNLWGPSSCRYSRLVCNPTDSTPDKYVVDGAMIFPCRSLPPDTYGECAYSHGHGVNGWHAPGHTMGRRRLTALSPRAVAALEALGEEF